MPFCKGNETRTVPVTLVPSRSGLIRIRFTVSDDAGYITYLELTTYCQQSYPVTTRIQREQLEQNGPYAAYLLGKSQSAE